MQNSVQQTDQDLFKLSYDRPDPKIHVQPTTDKLTSDKSASEPESDASYDGLMSRFGAWIVCELSEESGKRRKVKTPTAQVSLDAKGYLNSCLGQPPLETCLADLQEGSNVHGKVLAWALVEIDLSLDTLISEKSLERKILLEHYRYEVLVHMTALKVQCFQTNQPVVHTGTKNWPGSKVFDMNPDHVEFLLDQLVLGPGRETLRESLERLQLLDFGPTSTSLQLWAPISMLVSCARWVDVSLPAFFQWSAACSVFRQEETKALVEQAKAMATLHRTEVIGKPLTAGAEVLGPSGFNRLADQIANWAGMLLNGTPFEHESEQVRLELAIETCRTQAALLESIAAGSALDSLGGQGRYNVVFLLQTLWFAFNLKSDAVLRESLFHAVKVLYPGTQNTFFEQALANGVLPLPSRSILTQARFFLDLAFMSYIRAQNAARYPIKEECGALHLLVDSSPQGGFNGLMAQLLWISDADLRRTAVTANQLVQHAKHLNTSSEQGLVLQEDEIEAEIDLAKTVASCVHRHPCLPVGLGRGDLLHELHALYHTLFLETGNPKLLSHMVSSICSITSDRGVEAGYPLAPAYAFHDLFPSFVPPPVMQCDGGGFDLEPTGDEQQRLGDIDPEPDRLSLQGSLAIPGCLHIVHNATRHMLNAMPHFEQRARPGFSALVDFLHKNFTRQRFVATCLENSAEGIAFVPMFSSFPHTVVKWRFGTLAAVCKDLAPLEVPLRRFWNSDRLTFNQQSKTQEANPAPVDGAFGDNRLEGPNIKKAGEAVLSGAFWSWVHMICTLADWIGHVESWFESCPCHGNPFGHERMRVFAKMPCPLKNFRAPELAAQRFVPFLEELSNLSAAQVVLVHTRFCKDEDRTWILEDFEAGRQHLQFSFIMQTACWTHLPQRLCVLGHFDEAVARSEAAECLRIWSGMTNQEKENAHFWTKALPDPSTNLGQQLRAFIRGAQLQDPELEKLERVASKFKFIPLSEKPIEGRHAIIHKTLKKASNAGPVFLSMAERMPLMMQLSKSDPSFIVELARSSKSLYHPLQASIAMGLSNHPDLLPKLADVQQTRQDLGSCMVWGATHKHSKIVKKIVYHVDSTSQFMNLSVVPAMDDGPKRSEPKKNSTKSEGGFSFEERAAFQKLLDVHEPANVYTIDRDSSFGLQSLSRAVQGHSQSQSGDAPSLECADSANSQADGAGVDNDLLFDFQSDCGFDNFGAQTQRATAKTNCPIAFRILSLRPGQLKLPPVDVDLALVWTDVAVSILPVLEVSNLNSENASMVVGSCPDAPSAEAVSVMSKGGFATVRIWEKEQKLQCCFDPDFKSWKPEFAEAMVELADALVKASAFPNAVTGLLDSSLPEEQKQCLERLSGLGFVSQAPSGLWQLTQKGIQSFQIGFKLVKPRGLVDLELDVPLVERSESALLLALRKADWQLFQWRKSKTNPEPEPYPFEFPLCKPPKKYFYVNAGRQSVGQPYMAVLVGLSDKKLVDFFKRQGIYSVKHLQSDKYYSKLLSGTLDDSQKQDVSFAFAFDGEDEKDNDNAAVASSSTSKRVRKTDAKPKQHAGPFAPLAPQLRGQEVDKTLPKLDPTAAPASSSSSCKRKHDEVDSAKETIAEPKESGKPEAQAAAAARSGGGRDFVLAESFKWGCVSFKFRKKPAGFQVDCPNRKHYIKHDWGSTTTCSKSLVFTNESKEMVIRRLKNWAIEGLGCETREDHSDKSSDIAWRSTKKLLPDSELEKLRPTEVIHAGPVAPATKAKAKGKAAKVKPAKPSTSKKPKPKAKKQKNNSCCFDARQRRRKWHRRQLE